MRQTGHCWREAIRQSGVAEFAGCEAAATSSWPVWLAPVTPVCFPPFQSGRRVVTHVTADHALSQSCHRLEERERVGGTHHNSLTKNPFTHVRGLVHSVSRVITITRFLLGLSWLDCRLLLNLHNFDLSWAVAINDKSSASLPSPVQLWFCAAIPVNRTGRQLLTVPHIPNSSVGRSIRFELSSAVLRVFTVWTQPLILKLRIQPICPTSDITTGAGSARKWYQGQISIQPTTITWVKKNYYFFHKNFLKDFKV